MIPTLQFSSDTAAFIRAFASYGYRALVAGPVGREIVPPVPPTRFDEDESEEVDVLDDPDYLLACREYDMRLVRAAGKSLTLRADKDAVNIAGLDLQWPRRMARLKTWAGQQSLGGMMRERLDSLLPWTGKTPKKTKSPIRDDASKDSSPTWETILALTFESALVGVSGLMPGHGRVNAIDMGFSPADTKIALNPWLEVLVMIGVEFAPIAMIPSERFSEGYFAVYSGGLWYPFFRRMRVEPYYSAWDREEDRGLLPHQFTKLIDPGFSPGPFDDLQIPRRLLDNPDILWNEIERLKRIAGRETVAL